MLYSNRLIEHIDFLISRYPQLTGIRGEIIQGYVVMEKCYQGGGKLLVAGNGGSAADAGHIVAELMKGFRLARPVSEEFAKKLKGIDPERGEGLAMKLECPLEAISLAAHVPLSTAFINDVDGQGVFAQQLFGYGKRDDVFLGISTSGNSQNILDAAVVAKAMGIKVIGLTGASGEGLGQVADVSVKVPETEPYLVQELHLPIYHCWCMMLEERFFGSFGNMKGRKKP